MGEKYRILSFDGGGIRGLLSTVMLEQLSLRIEGDRASRVWIDEAKLIAGTSVGGMIAIGLSFGLTPSALRQFFYDRGPIMFEDTLLDDLWNVWRLLGAEYSTRNRREVLEDILKDTTLGDLDQKVLIPTFDLYDPDHGSWKAKFFHNFEVPVGAAENADRCKSAADVALYTSAAPTYFPSVDGYVDGGIVANNPAMAALMQTQDDRYACSIEGFEDVCLLSVGTGKNPTGIRGEARDWGYVQWGMHLATAVDDGLIGIADYQCRQLLGDRYCRVDFSFPHGEGVGVDEYEKRDYLVDVGETRMARLLDCVAEWLERHWR